MVKRRIGWAIYIAVILILAVLPYVAKLPLPEDAIRVDSALFTPETGTTTPVTLPHRMSKMGEHAETGTYDVVFELEDMPQTPLYVFVPAVKRHLEIEQNGEVIFDSRIRQSWVGPANLSTGFILLPRESLRSGTNHLRLILYGEPVIPSYLSAIYLGPKETVEPYFKLRVFVSEHLVKMAFSSMITLGLGVLIAFLFRPKDKVFGWLSVLAGLSTVYQANMFADIFPAIMGYLPYIYVLIPSFGCLMVVFTLSLIDRRPPRILIIAAVVLPLFSLVLIVGNVLPRQTVFQFFTTPVLTLGLFSATMIACWAALREKHMEAALMIGPWALMGWYMLHDMLMVRGLLDGVELLTQNARPLFVLILTLMLMRRLSVSLNELDKSEEILVARLNAQRQQLSAQTVELEGANTLLAEINKELEFQKLALDEHAIVSIADVQGNITYANDKFCQLSGYSRDELLGQNHRITKSNEHSDEFYSEMWRTIANGKPWQGDVKNKKKDGRYYWVTATIVPFLNASGKPDKYVSIRTDLTEHKNTEAELRQISRHKAISQLAEGISHEINTPIQYIQSGLEFIRDSVADMRSAYTAHKDALDKTEPELEYLFEETPVATEEALSGVEKIRLIVQAMKEFSLLSGTTKEEVDINRALSTILTVSHNAWKASAEMETDLDPDLPSVYGIGADLNQVFLDLIVNANDAILDKDPHQMGTINIKTTTAGQWVEVRISDTGSGIPENVADHIFNPFFTTKEPGAGIGQGLTVSYDSIVNKHDGTLTFESEEGKGTTFVVRLPVFTAQAR